MTKAGTLKFLAGRLKKSVVGRIYTFAVGDFERQPEKVVAAIQREFPHGNLVVRSSAEAEDGLEKSLAGAFYSEIGVPSGDACRILDAIRKVVASYQKVPMQVSRQEILVQPCAENVKMSGVVLTRCLETGAPYYVVNYDETGNTAAVTSGDMSCSLIISRFLPAVCDQKWRKLIAAIRELEAVYGGSTLDIEFGILDDGRIQIFQARLLAANKNAPVADEKCCRKLLYDMCNKFQRYSKLVPHLAGRRTVLGDMPDWNPAEIVGDRPNTLDYTLYRFIITDKVWHEARTSLGYKDVYPGELITPFGEKP